MKKRAWIALTSLAGLTGLAVGAKIYQTKKEDDRLKEIVLSVRQFFTPMGEIATVYIDQTTSDHLHTRGGVVMVDRRVFHFEYLAGELFYEEEIL